MAPVALTSTADCNALCKCSSSQVAKTSTAISALCTAEVAFPSWLLEASGPPAQGRSQANV